MSYNVDSTEIISGELRMDPVKAAWFVANHAADLPECEFLTEHAKRGPEIESLANAWWYGEGSGSSWKLYLEALALTEGAAEIVATWEGGDSFSGLRVRNGVVTEMDVKFTLVPKR